LRPFVAKPFGGYDVWVVGADEMLRAFYFFDCLNNRRRFACLTGADDNLDKITRFV
jgi:hypothetical protein